MEEARANYKTVNAFIVLLQEDMKPPKVCGWKEAFVREPTAANPAQREEKKSFAWATHRMAQCNLFGCIDTSQSGQPNAGISCGRFLLTAIRSNDRAELFHTFSWCLVEQI